MKTKAANIAFWVFIAVVIFVSFMEWLDWGRIYNPVNLPEFTILNGECLFEINTNGVQVLHNDRLKVIIDGKEYYIQLYPTSFYREVMP